MTPRLVAIIAVRILALYLLLTGLSIIPAFSTMRFSGFFLLDPQYLIIILGALIWFLAKPIANLIVGAKASTAKHPKSRLTRYEIEVISFSIIGLLLLARAIPGLFSLITYHKSIASLASDPIIELEAVASFKSSLVYHIIRIIIGAYLLCIPNHFASVLETIRSKIINMSWREKGTSNK